MADIKNSVLSREQDGSIKLTVTLSQADIAKTREEFIIAAVVEAEVSGFRKGKAPRNVVEERLDDAKIQEEILKKLLPKAYVKAVEEHNLKPVMNPKIHIQKIDPSAHSGVSGQAGSGQVQDWIFEAITCEAPKIELNDYKDKVKSITAKSKIILPGKEPSEPNFDEIMQAVLAATVVEIPGILVQQESDRLLAQMLDEVKKLGLTLDQYLSSTGKTPETLRAEFEEKAKADMKLEFVLQKIADEEKITIEQKEIDEAIQKAKDPKERENLSRNHYLLASILRQQKTLDFLKNL